MKKLIVSEVGFRKILIIHTIIFNYIYNNYFIFIIKN